MPNTFNKTTLHTAWETFRKFVNVLSSLIIVCAAILAIVFLSMDSSIVEDSALIGEEISEEQDNCNTAGIELHGEIVTYIPPSELEEEAGPIENKVASENIMGAIQQAELDEKIKAIILEIDSYGGNPVAAEEIASALKTASKPTIALVRTAAVSAAYWSATGADSIFASAISDIGGIGVSSSYLDNSMKNSKEGLTFNSLSSGKFKDYMNPDKPLTEAERQLIMRDVYIINDNFIKAVASNRKLDSDGVRALADGSTVLGETALKNGLIDKIGGITEVKEYLKEKIGEDIEICW